MTTQQLSQSIIYQRWPLWSFHHISACLLSLLTHYIISKTNGAEGNEGEIEALAKRPAFHVTEQQRRDDQKQQTARDEEQAHCQSLDCLLGSEHKQN